MDRKKTIISKLKNFKKDVSGEFKISYMYLFGSRAAGKPHRYSDIDLIIVSPKFRGLDFFRRGAKMYDYWNLNYPVDFLCYTPEEFNKLKKQTTIVGEAVKSGVKI
ncbi:nucleotidyltransferase domain-containing protein [Candidatus Woesearchaeota archaeon]|nr:nucleotidyltransferase domain-containing protein [Candidatus Woesearchaeota archaeon]